MHSIEASLISMFFKNGSLRVSPFRAEAFESKPRQEEDTHCCPSMPVLLDKP